MSDGPSELGANPAFLGRLNARLVAEAVRLQGPQTRAEIKRCLGLTAPTVSKAVESLIGRGLIEEGEASPVARGRPGKILRLATRAVRVLGVVLDAGKCSVVSSGLDGLLQPERIQTFSTPRSYSKLIDAIVSHVKPQLREKGIRTLGLGISMPGLIDRKTSSGLLSPNLHVTDGRAPGRDLARRLGIECVVRNELHGLGLAECLWGGARGLSDFVMLDVSTGLGLAIMSGGRMLEGVSGLAGELGHMTIDLQGRRCGCGNHGCLETLGTDSAFVHAASERLHRTVDIREALRQLSAGAVGLSEAIQQTRAYLAVAIGAAINIFNPSTLFVHGRILEAQEDFWPRLEGEVRRHALAPALKDCRVVRASAGKLQGALAVIVWHLLDSLAPAPVGRFKARGAHP